MRKIASKLQQALSLAACPLRLNGAFFVFMYVLGCLCSWITTTTQPYDGLYAELFVDLTLISVVLALIPRKVRTWVRRLIYLIFYATAICDVYCFVKYDSTLSPTILMLVGETDSREAGEFLTTVLDPSVLLTPLGWIVLLMLVHLIFATRRWWGRKWLPRLRPSLSVDRWQPIAGALVIVLFIVSWSVCAANKKRVHDLMTAPTIGKVEHLLTKRPQAELYEPVYRLAFSLYSNHLANQQVDQLIQAADKVRVDSCSFRSPRIVLIIGESFGPHHSQQYGYRMPTTPRQLRREQRGELYRFTDVIAPWNLTSYVFKNVFSLHVVGQEGEWCDYPLFPEVFRKAGYHVTFLTNQFLPKAKEEVYDFSGGFFLNNPTLSKEQFDVRNDSLHQFDEGLLRDYEHLRRYNTGHDLIIFHLLGQHMTYRDRFPKDRAHFDQRDYISWRPELNSHGRTYLASYDNAVLYNDSIVDQIVKFFEKDNAIVIYMPDHGEECFEENRNFCCRHHSQRIDYKLAKYEFLVPFWIWCSPTYRQQHPDIVTAIKAARNRRFMTDALPHLLLYLAGISTPDYHPEYNLISPQYDEMRPRILKGYCDYDKLKKE